MFLALAELQSCEVEETHGASRNDFLIIPVFPRFDMAFHKIAQGSFHERPII